MKNKRLRWLIEILRRINPLLGGMKWNLMGVDERTLRRWINGDSTPSVTRIRTVATAVWKRCSDPALKQKVFQHIQQIVPSAPCDRWTEETFVDWFVRMAEPKSEDLKLEIDVELWIPDGGRFLSVRNAGPTPLDWNSRVRVRVWCDAFAYLHVIWVDSRGRATPLYPWKTGEWEQLDVYEPKDELILPGGFDYWTIESPEGIESVVVAASLQPLNSDNLIALRRCWRELNGEMPTSQLAPYLDYDFQHDALVRRINTSPIERQPMSDRSSAICEQVLRHCPFPFPYVRILSIANRGKRKRVR